MCSEVAGVGVSLTACLHSNFEAGFKKTKQEDSPLPEVCQPTETFPGSSVVIKHRPMSGGGRLARREADQGHGRSRSRPRAASSVAGNVIPRLLPDSWVMVDRGPSMSIGKVQIPGPLGCWPTLWLVAVPSLGVLVALTSLSVFAGKMEGVCFRDHDMKRTQPQCVCV